jgi:hypothetical protein
VGETFVGWREAVVSESCGQAPVGALCLPKAHPCWSGGFSVGPARQSCSETSFWLIGLEDCAMMSRHALPAGVSRCGRCIHVAAAAARQ